jgi:hypothetical protein
MSRKVFFSFHFRRDAWRAGQIRNSGVLADEDEYGVIDSVAWEKIEREGKEAIKRWINDQMKYTSVTVVLIGAQTSDREWVEYEIEKSWERGNGLVGIRVHSVKDHVGETDTAGTNPLDEARLANGKTLSSIFRTYDWVSDDGRANLGRWVEEAFELRRNYAGEMKLAAEDGAHRTPRPAYGGGPTVISNPPRPWAR